MSKCKWISEDDQEICCNGACPMRADFCPLVAYPWLCKYYEEAQNERRD